MSIDEVPVLKINAQRMKKRPTDKNNFFHQRGIFMSLRHEELTEIIFGCIFEVHNNVGVGLDEETYHQSIDVKHRDKLVRTCKIKALLIANQTLCRVTAIQEKITLFDVKRMRTYLKHSGIPIGLLINFGKSNLEIKAIHG